MDDRKKRLEALRAKAGRINISDPDGTSIGDQPTVALLHPEPDGTFADSGTKKRARPAEGGEENASQKQPAQKSALEEALEKAKRDLESRLDPSLENDALQANTTELTTMAPKKINWDLKRDIKTKLDKLEKKTQKAIVQLLRERLAKEADAAPDSAHAQDLD
jgi:coiled-coil domain-containing protein 12